MAAGASLFSGVVLWAKAGVAISRAAALKVAIRVYFVRLFRSRLLVVFVENRPRRFLAGRGLGSGARVNRGEHSGCPVFIQTSRLGITYLCCIAHALRFRPAMAFVAPGTGLDAAHSQACFEAVDHLEDVRWLVIRGSLS